ncbi:MAG: hypothetical protein WC824_14175, partial [Bacteroidota bacterium]
MTPQKTQIPSLGPSEWYHGTTWNNALSLLKGYIGVQGSGNDLGSGFYVTDNLTYARMSGKAVVIISALPGAKILDFAMRKPIRNYRELIQRFGSSLQHPWVIKDQMSHKDLEALFYTAFTRGLNRSNVWAGRELIRRGMDAIGDSSSGSGLLIARTNHFKVKSAWFFDF